MSKYVAVAKSAAMLLASLILALYILKGGSLLSLDAVSAAFMKNMIAVFTLLPGIIVYLLAKELLKVAKVSTQTDANFSWCLFLKHLAVVTIVCLFISIYPGGCDEYGDCDFSDATPLDRMTSFLRLLMVTAVGLVVAHQRS